VFLPTSALLISMRAVSLATALVCACAATAAATTAPPPPPATPTPSCRSPSGSPVDWWLALKHPGGDVFSYTDAEAGDGGGGGWAPATSGLGDPASGPLARTLAPLYAPSPPAHALWNDEPPPSAAHNASEAWPWPPAWGHAKGALLLDGRGGAGGAFLLHSVPLFPPPPPIDGGVTPYAGLPHPQRLWGQSFLCVSLGRDGARALVAGLAGGVVPRTYAAGGGGGGSGGEDGAGAGPTPADVDALYPGFAALAAPSGGSGGGVKPAGPVPAGLASARFSTAGGARLALFTSAGRDPPALLWDEGVAPGLAGVNASSPASASAPLLPPPAPLAVATWRRGPGAALPPTCAKTSPAVLNVLSIRPPGAGRRAWSGEADHGKWGVTLSGGGDAPPPAACVGDANREASQARRGGAVLCLVGGRAGVAASAALRGAVAVVDACGVMDGDGGVAEV
jgi:hypothetical protein